MLDNSSYSCLILWHVILFFILFPLIFLAIVSAFTKKESMWYLVRECIDWVKDIPKEIKYFIQRGKRGYSDRDTWDLDRYLAHIIIDSVTHLKKHTHGYPTTCKSAEEWESILNKIIKTFDYARKILETNVYYTPSEIYNTPESQKDRETVLKIFKEVNVKYPDYTVQILTFEECLEYEEGWKLLQEHFFGLWD